MKDLRMSQGSRARKTLRAALPRFSTGGPLLVEMSADGGDQSELWWRIAFGAEVEFLPAANEFKTITETGFCQGFTEIRKHSMGIRIEI